MNNRSIMIDSLRGIACIFLVIFHIIGDTPESGLRISEGVYRHLNDLLAYVRMPLFTFLSGVVYAYRPFIKGAKSFIGKKARRLLLPMLFVGTLFAILQSVTPGTNGGIENWYMLHIVPVAHFWFIESLFLLFLLMVVLEKFEQFNSIKSWLIVFVISSSAYISPIHFDYFSFSGFIYLTPFFLLGMAIVRYDLHRVFTLNVSIILSVIIVLFLSLVYGSLIPIYDKRTLVGLLLGVSSCLALYSLGVRNSTLARIGVFSYSIYIYHVFFTASVRIVFLKIGLHSNELIIIASLIAAILGSIFVEITLGRINYVRALFLGKAVKVK